MARTSTATSARSRGWSGRSRKTLLAADHPGLDLTRLGTIPASEYDELRFHLHPSARLFASEYPCLRIWQANVGGDSEPDVIDLSAGGDTLLLMRSAGQLAFHALSPGEMAFLQAIRAWKSLSEAVEHGAAAGAFDATAALQRFVPAGAIVDFERPL